jgi:hypothetical protein
MELFKYMKVCHGVRRLPPPHCRHQAPLGTPRHQSDKSTVYTPARECYSRIALELFNECLMLQLFDAVNDLTDVLRNQLAAETDLQLILNEGAANTFSCKGSQIWASRWKIRAGILRSYINEEIMAS